MLSLDVCPFTVTVFLRYHCCRKRLARELEGQSSVQAVQEERVRVMESTNPRVILRNYIAQNAIEAAENGDFSEVRLGSTVTLLSFPFKILYTFILSNECQFTIPVFLI